MNSKITTVAYRVPSGYTHSKGTTVRDVLNYEFYELGNQLSECEYPDWILAEPANDCAWVCEKKYDVFRYLTHIEEKIIDVQLHNAYILAFDNESGMLVYQKGIQYEV